MASQSLYRKWRSQTFSDLVGQEATVRTLLNAVREGRLAHAYLFCGPRGTGKTTLGRLLAKAVNCTAAVEGEPCNACESCLAFNEGRALDFIEQDAASHNRSVTRHGRIFPRFIVSLPSRAEPRQSGGPARTRSIHPEVPPGR